MNMPVVPPVNRTRAIKTFAVIGLFYYLRVIRLMYFEEPEDETPVVVASDMRVMLSSNALVIVLLGIYPSALMTLCINALG